VTNSPMARGWTPHVGHSGFPATLIQMDWYPCCPAVSPNSRGKKSKPGTVERMTYCYPLARAVATRLPAEWGTPPVPSSSSPIEIFTEAITMWLMSEPSAGSAMS